MRWMNSAKINSIMRIVITQEYSRTVIKIAIRFFNYVFFLTPAISLLAGDLRNIVLFFQKLREEKSYFEVMGRMVLRLYDFFFLEYTGPKC